MKNLSPNGLRKFCFLFGDDIGHSISPNLHNSWFEKFSLNYSYFPCQIQSEKSFLATVQSLMEVDNFLGANITKPFKNSVLKLSNISYSSHVKSVGAANTLYQNQDGKWCLENTDLLGIQKTMEDLLPYQKPYDLVVLGGGGAAASCLYVGEKQSPFCEKIFCLTRSLDKMSERYSQNFSYQKVQFFQSVTLTSSMEHEIKSSLCSCVVLVNTLPSNASTNKIVVDCLESLSKINPQTKVFYFDLNYLENSTHKYAKEQGFSYLNGIKMLEEQAKESFFLWTKKRPE